MICKQEESLGFRAVFKSFQLIYQKYNRKTNVYKAFHQ